MMDRDFPIGAREAKITLVALAIGGTIGALVFGGVIPGLHPYFSPPAIVELDGQPYHWTTFYVPTPILGKNATPPATVHFQNVTFDLWVTNYVSFTNQTLAGNATLANGTVYAFALEARLDAKDRVTQFISPDDEVAVEWNLTALAYLFVHA